LPGPGEDDDRASVRLVTGFRLRGEIADVEAIAAGRSVRVLARLRKVHGGGRGRKLEGRAFVELPDGTGVLAELHWYEAHGVGRKDMKIKRLLE
jgi:hypothetical protein